MHNPGDPGHLIGPGRTNRLGTDIGPEIGARAANRSSIERDKTLDGCRIEVHVRDEGLVILDGLVVDDEDKEKAIALIRDSRGVTRIEDRLAVMPPPRIIDADPGDDDSRDVAEVDSGICTAINELASCPRRIAGARRTCLDHESVPSLISF